MARIQLLSFLSLTFGGALVAAADDAQITDLPLFSLLAPCAQYALSYPIMYQTESCGENNNLQSCICTKDNNKGAIWTSISRSLSYSCESTATDDVSSASIVYDAYCDPDKSFALPTPTTNLITALVTDVPQFFNLAQCAQSGLSYAAVSAMSSLCPSPVSLYADCMCTRNGHSNSASVQKAIKSGVSRSCENNEDITSAQDFFSAYCNMVNGTTDLPMPSNPPGDMSYYITALDQFSSLAPCAQSALSRAIDYQTNSACPEGPQALASCVCIKSGRYGTVMSLLTSSVKNYCESTALEDVTSAAAVLEYYCQAASGEATATVAESIKQTYPAAITGTGSGDSAPTPKNTGGANGGEGGDGDGDGTTGDGSSSNNSSGGGGGGGGSSVGAIAGGVAAGAGIVLIAGLVAWLIIRRKKKAAAAAAAAASANIVVHDPSGAGSPPPVAGKPELGGVAMLHPQHSPSPSTYKDGTVRTDSVSPVSPYGRTPSHTTAELHGQAGFPVPEMPGSQQAPPTEMHASHQWGQGYQPPTGQQYGQSLPPPQELQGHQPQHPGYGPPGSQASGMGWQSGPYSEFGPGQGR